MIDTIATVDSGGTKVTAIAVPEISFGWKQSTIPANLRRWSEARSGNLNEIGDSGVEALATAIINNLGIVPANTRLVVGMAGITTEPDAERVVHIFEKAGFNRNSVEAFNDSNIGLRAIDDQGMVLVAGTGQNSVGSVKGGKLQRVGGWGHIIGDEGSGFYLGKRAINSAIFALDGRGPQTSLLQTVFDHFKVETLEDIISKIYGQSNCGSYPSKIAALAPYVVSAALKGDLVAKHLIEETEVNLSTVIHAMFTKLAINDAAVVLIGGMFKDPSSQVLLLDPITARLAKVGIIPRFKKFDDGSQEMLAEAARCTLLQDLTSAA
jgi:N-acetylglucosamine kinase-like BadF-type ATPase